MKLLKQLFFTSIACLFFFTTYAGGEHILKLKSGNEELIALESTSLLDDQFESLETDYVIIQFYKVPTQAQKNKISSNGITLLEYLPNYSFLATYDQPSNIEVGDLNIRSIVEYKKEFKLAPRLANEEKPDWAMAGQTAILLLEKQHNTSKFELISALNSEGIEIESIDPSEEVYEISIPHKKIDAFSENDYVKYLDYIPAPPEKEDIEGITLHRGNLLDSDHPLGRKYDGTGISMTIADDGAIGPHIDLKGRVTQFVTFDNGGHGDMTTGIAMGAGNLNPRIQGMATGAYLYYYNISGYPHIANAVSNFNNRGVVVSSTSYSEGCNAGYTSLTRAIDQQVRRNPEILHVFSAGNSAGLNCNYGAGTGWGTITGGRKQGKSVIATGNLNYVGSIVSSSSRGPAYDGRIKPDICANGGSQMSIAANNSFQTGSGTSAAAPGLAGIAVQLYHGYKDLHGDTLPESGLIKAAMLNTARDLGRPGPDFDYGWGRVNGHRAMLLLEENRYFDDTISQGNTHSYTINIGATNLQELNFMIYWTDYEAATSAATALVNDIDLRVVSPGNDTILPWILDDTPNTASLSSNATRGNDDLNNVEQVSIDTVNSGNYTLLVSGTNIPQGPQKFIIVWETRDDGVEITYPNGGEAFVPGETETIRWDASGTNGSFLIAYSTDSGSTWTNISVAGSSSRYRDWLVPSNIAISKNVLIRVERRVGRTVVATDTSDFTLSTMRLAANLKTEFVCFDSIGVSWRRVPGATAYEVSLLGDKYMDSVSTTSDTSFIFQGTTFNDDNWFSVRAIKNDIIGRRANAVQIPDKIFNCPFNYDLAINKLASPSSSYLLDCNVSKVRVEVELQNKGDSTLSNVPMEYIFNNVTYRDTFPGPLVKGATSSFIFKDSLGLTQTTFNRLKVKALLNNDEDFTNDSLENTFDVLTSTVKTLPFSETFDTMTTCATTSNCGTTICSLTNDWSNMSTRYDIFDMRVHRGSTPSTGTGPSADHTLGTSIGQYIYAEASNGCYEQESQVLSPCIDLSNTLSPELSFWYHMNGQFMGRMQVDIYSDGAMDSVFSVDGSQGASWINKKINLSPYIGKTINIRFLFTTGSFWSSDMAIDDVSIIDLSTSLDQVEIDNRFNVYPNPSEGLFTIEFNELPQTAVDIYDLNGRLLKTMRINSNVSNIDLSSYEKGIYILNVHGTKVHKKLVIH